MCAHTSLHKNLDIHSAIAQNTQFEIVYDGLLLYRICDIRLLLSLLLVLFFLPFVFYSATLTMFVLRIHIRGVTYILLHAFSSVSVMCVASRKAKAL